MARLVAKNKAPRYQVQFHIDPLVEILVALMVLADPHVNPVWRDWRDRSRAKLGAEFCRNLDDLYKRYNKLLFAMDLGTYCALLAGENTEDGYAPLSAELDVLWGLTEQDFTLYMLGLEVEGPADERASFDSDLMIERVYEIYGRIMEEEDMQMLFTDAAAIRERLISLLWTFHKEVFGEMWPGIRTAMTRSPEGQMLLSGDKLSPDYLKHYFPMLDDMDHGQIVFDDQQEFKANLTDLKDVHIFLSVFNGERLFYNLVDNELILYLGIPYQPPQQTLAEVPAKLMAAAKCFSDDGRVQILRLLWNSEATTSELAEILSLANSTVSVHLKTLRSAGLVASRRVKKEVLYRTEQMAVRKALTDLGNFMINNAEEEQ